LPSLVAPAHAWAAWRQRLQKSYSGPAFRNKKLSSPGPHRTFE
jgi:hypothetical protein